MSWHTNAKAGTDFRTFTRDDLHCLRWWLMMLITSAFTDRAVHVERQWHIQNDSFREQPALPIMGFIIPPGLWCPPRTNFSPSWQNGKGGKIGFACLPIKEMDWSSFLALIRILSGWLDSTNCLSACLHACLFAYLPTCQPVCLSTCLSASPPPGLPTPACACLSACRLSLLSCPPSTSVGGLALRRFSPKWYRFHPPPHPRPFWVLCVEGRVPENRTAILIVIPH